MEKIVLMLMIGLSFIQAEGVEQDCLSCHQAQQIPSELIYRRYLMRYSTDDTMKQAIAKYLKDPKKSSSIMPPQFFLKFPMKEKLEISDEVLEKDIQMFLERFTIKKKLKFKK